MTKARREFSEEFKVEAVRLVMVEGHPARRVAEDLGIHESLLRRWRRRLERQAVGTTSIAPNNSRSPATSGAAVEQEEIRRLKRENDRLRMERDILKKAISIFSEAPK